MKLLPWVLKLRIVCPGFWMPTLWLPVFLLWPIVFLFAIPAFILGLIAILIFDTRSLLRFCRLCGGLYLTLCEFRGTHVDVEGDGSQVYISIL